MSSASNYEIDEYDEYNYEQDKLTGHGGKGKRVIICHFPILVIFQLTARLMFFDFGSY